MDRNYKFKRGQEVKMRDEEDGQWVLGVVTDTTTESVFVKWEDLWEPCQHLQSEFFKIKLVAK